MKKKFTYLFLLLVFFAVTAFVVIKYKQGGNKPVSFIIKDRHGPSALLPEWANTRKRALNLYSQVAAKPDNVPASLQLVSLYIQEARITGDYTYYDAAAMKLLESILEKNPRQFDALVFKGILQLSQHHFSDALETAALAQSINPYSSFVYGIMVDGNVELGNYDEAVKSCDKMMDIKPDIRSYSRASYLREIYGDYKGAIEAMKLAVDAGVPGEEATEWARIQLAKMYESTGDILSAEMHYTIALNERPAYPHALAGLARIETQKNNYQKAISILQEADPNADDISIQEQLAELYTLTHESRKASDALDKILASLTKAQEGGEMAINHHADKELAYVYLKKNDPVNALKHATIEYNRRPDNIDVNEAMAWCLYKNNESQKALAYISKALRTNAQNPALLCHAAIVYASAGNNAQAKQLLQKVQLTHPVMDRQLLAECESLLNRP